MSLLFDFFNKTKDHLLDVAGKAAARKWFIPYGDMLDLSINTQDKTLSATLLLNGETQPIQLELKHYQLDQEDGKTFLVIDPADVATSREWLNQVVTNALKPMRLEIPSQYAWVVKLLA